MIQYPKQIFCVQGGNQSSLSATFDLQKPKETGAVPPLQMHEGNLSRFTLTLLDTSTGATLPFIANIPATDIPVMSKKTDIALLLKAQYVPAENKSSLSDCYIQKLRFGKFKGKTAAEVLLSDPTAKSDMESTRDLLQKNVEKYPANKVLVNAIDEAIMLFEAGELKEQSTQNTAQSSMTIYHKEYKSTRRANPKGLYLCYSISVDCQFDMDYSWQIKIDNYFAPSVSGKIDHKKAEGRKSASIRLTDDDWALCVSQFENLKNLYESKCFPELLERADATARRQAEEAKTKKAQ